MQRKGRSTSASFRDAMENKSRIRRIGIYGGTFAPPHNGHIKAADEFYVQAEIDELYIIPTAIPPHKQIDCGDDPHIRFEMLELAFKDRNYVISDYEIKNFGKSYTVNTLEYFSEKWRELVFLVGTDMFLTLDQWYRAERIFELAEIAYIRREAPEFETEKLISEKIDYYKSRYRARLRFVEAEPFVVSSSEIRTLVKNGGSLDGLLPEDVIAYINEKNLYKEPENG